jgi:hypothetical protein
MVRPREEVRMVLGGLGRSPHSFMAKEGRAFFDGNQT